MLFKEVRIPSNDHEAQLVKPLDDCEVSSDVVRHVMELDSNLEHVGQGAAVSKGHFTVISFSLFANAIHLSIHCIIESSSAPSTSTFGI